MIRDGLYVVPDVVWKDPDGDRYAAHVVRRGHDARGTYVLIEFEDDGAGAARACTRRSWRTCDEQP